jgi:arylsulfatase A-like enzyme
LKLGVIPPGTKLTPRPAEIPAWDSLTPEQKRVEARLMEAFAAYTAQTDYEVGRVLDALDETGITNNTLGLWEIGDNGASIEGTLNGAFNEFTALAGIPEDPSYLLKHIDEIGGPNAYNHIPVGWAWACNTPFQWGKQVASRGCDWPSGESNSWSIQLLVHLDTRVMVSKIFATKCDAACLRVPDITASWR